MTEDRRATYDEYVIKQRGPREYVVFPRVDDRSAPWFSGTEAQCAEFVCGKEGRIVVELPTKEGAGW